jgi:hypothetical protein
MSDDDNERAAPFTKADEASSHKLRADALPLATGWHSHRCQSLPEGGPPINHRRCKEDMTHDRAVIFSHQRQRVAARPPQSIDEVGLRWSPERKLIDVSNLERVFRSLEANDHHA